MNAMRVVLLGIGGYGNGYVDALLDQGEEMGATLTGAVDPRPEGCRRLSEVQAAVGKVHASLEEYLASGSDDPPAELAVISGPIPVHERLTIDSLRAGMHVLCEKPVAGSIEELERMREAEHRTGKRVSIGFQWSFVRPVRALRSDILAGRFGAPRRMRSLTSWPRGFAYYNRASWAGRVRMPDGSWVRDSPVNNATAHFLHNLFYLLGIEELSKEQIDALEADLYRVNAIESFDTAVLRLHDIRGAEIYFATTHASATQINPITAIELEHASVYHQRPGTLVARTDTGEEIEYGPTSDEHSVKIKEMVAALAIDERPPCSLEEARPALQVACALDYETGIKEFPPELVEKVDEGVHVPMLAQAMVQAYAAGKLLREIGFPTS